MVIVSSRRLFRFLWWWLVWFGRWGQRWLRPIPRHADALVIHCPATMSLLPPLRPWYLRWVAPSASLWQFQQDCLRIGQISTIHSVVLVLPELSMQLADLQSLRDCIRILQGYGKTVICFAQTYTIAEYYVASAANQIVVQTGGIVALCGLQEKVFTLEPFLARLGVRVDTIATSPYKGAGATLFSTPLTDTVRQHITTTMESQLAMVLDAIRHDRHLSHDQLNQIIHDALHTDQEALQFGIIDRISYEEELYFQLGITHPIHWDQAQKWLPWRLPSRSASYIGIVLVQGILESTPQSWMSSLLPSWVRAWVGQQIYDRMLVQQLRRLTDDPTCSGVILVIDCEGGSASASEAVYIAAKYLADAKPLVAFLHGIAASGGYLIVTPAHQIIAQAGTLVGSVGVIYSKYVFQPGLIQNLGMGMETFNQGRNAGILKHGTPFTDEQRAIVDRIAKRTEALFLDHITTHRTVTADQLATIRTGHVWTANHAQTHGLVDSLGGLDTAIQWIYAQYPAYPQPALYLINDQGRHQYLG